MRVLADGAGHRAERVGYLMECERRLGLPVERYLGKVPLSGVFTSIFNKSLAKSVVPTFFKRSTIVPVPKNNKPSSLNDYRPVTLTSVVMKVFERLLKNIISSSIPTTTDPLQFAYCSNRSTEDAISHVLHTTLNHVDEKRGVYVRLLFIDYSSAFNTIEPHRLFIKLRDLALNIRLCAYISGSITTNTGAPQGCVFSPLEYSLYTSDCVATNGSNFIVKFADNTVVLGFISGNNEKAYMDEVENLALWYRENCLQLNIMDSFYVSQDQVQIGLAENLPYSDKGFLLNTSQEAEDLKKLFQSMIWPRGSSLNLHLMKILTERYTVKAGSRASKGVPQMGVVVTDTWASSLPLSEVLKNNGVTMYAIGIERASKEYLRMIASNPQNIFDMQQVDHLKSVVSDIGEALCDSAEVTLHAPKVCPQGIEADIVFFVDGSGDIGPEEFVWIKDFLYVLVNMFYFGQDQVRVGMVQYSDTFHTECKLDTYRNKRDMQRCIWNVQQISNSTSINGQDLDSMLTHLFREAAGRGTSKGIPQLGVIITGSQSTTRVKELAMALKEDNILPYAIVTKNAVLEELRKIGIKPEDIYMLSDFSGLKHITQKISQSLCAAATEGRQRIVHLTPGPSNEHSKLMLHRGRSLTVHCHYNEMYMNHVKYWCRMKSESACVIIVNTEAPQSIGIVSITDDPTENVFYVTMRDLQTTDTDVYWCGVETSRKEIYMASINLTVTAGSVDVSVGNNMVTSDPGKSVTVTCFYSEGNGDQEKKWCRGEDWSSCLTTGGNETQQDRTHLKIDHVLRILSVTVSKLEQNDTDWYWCASGGNRIPVHISVVAENESYARRTASQSFAFPLVLILQRSSPHWEQILHVLLHIATALVFLICTILVREIWDYCRKLQGPDSYKTRYPPGGVSLSVSLVKIKVRVCTACTVLFWDAPEESVGTVCDVCNEMITYSPVRLCWKNVNMEVMLMLLLFSRCFGSNVATAKVCPPSAVMDIVFLAESSYIKPEGWFDNVKNFFCAIVDSFYVSQDQVQIGLAENLPYSDKGFLLNTSQEAEDLKKLFQSMIWPRGSSLNLHLMKILTERYTVKAGSRASKGVPQMGVVVTDTWASSLPLSEVLKNNGVTMYAIGIERASKEYLRMIASNPQNIFDMQQVDHLKSVVSDIGEALCDSAEVTLHAPKVCPQGMEADIVFFVDGSGDIGPEEFVWIKDFLYVLVNMFYFGQDQVRVGMVQYSDTFHTECKLDTYRNKRDMQRCIWNVQQISNSTSINGQDLDSMLTHLFREAAGRGTSKGIPQLGVIIIGSQSTTRVKELAMALKEDNILPYAIVTKNAVLEDLRKIGIKPEDIYMLSDFSGLKHITQKISQSLCAAATEGRQRIVHLTPGPSNEHSKLMLHRGRSLTVHCHYNEMYMNHVKYWCRMKSESACAIIVNTEAPQSIGIVSITDDPTENVFYVTMRDLQTTDTDVYWCGVETSRKEIYMASINLTVTAGSVDVSVGNNMVTSDPGKSVTVTCFYSEGNGDQEKKWCRGEDWSSCLTTGGNETQQDRTHLKIDHVLRILSVTVSKLEQNDTDWYWCASGGNRIPVHISVVAENESYARRTASQSFAFPLVLILQRSSPHWEQILHVLLHIATALVFLICTILVREIWDYCRKLQGPDSYKTRYVLGVSLSVSLVKIKVRVCTACTVLFWDAPEESVGTVCDVCNEMITYSPVRLCWKNVNMEVMLMLLLFSRCFGSNVATAKVCPPSAVMDIVFLAESSYIKPEGWFDNVKNFFCAIVDSFYVSQDQVQIGLAENLPYSDKGFLLNTSQEAEDLKKLFQSMIWPRGSSLNLHLMKILTERYTVKAGSRASKGVPQMGVVVTDTWASSLPLSEVLKNNGVTMYAIGIERASKEYLRMIASNPQNIFDMQQVDHLKSVVSDIGEALCDSAEVTLHAPKVCPQGMEADIVFFVDGSGDIGPEEFVWIKDFLYVLVNMFYFGQDQVRVGMVQYSDTFHTECKLDTYRNKRDMQRCIWNVQQISNSTSINGQDLDSMLTHLFREAAGRGTSKGIPQLGVIITGSQSTTRVKELAMALKEDNILPYAIVTKNAVLEELRKIGIKPEDIYMLSDFSGLKHITQKISQSLCAAATEGRQRIVHLTPGPSNEHSKLMLHRGRSLTVHCHYNEMYMNHVKYWCRMKSESACVIIVNTEAPQSIGIVSITDDPTENVFYVTMRDLQTTDTDVYWCGVETSRKEIYMASINLIVTAGSVDVSVGNNMVTSDPGKSVTVTCFYSERNGDQEKKWCRGEDWSSCLTTGGNETQQDRTHLKIDHVLRILSVTVSKLEQNDTDWYWCASGGNRIPVHISVVAENESYARRTASQSFAFPLVLILQRSSPHWEQILHVLLHIATALVFLICTILVSREIWDYCRKLQGPDSYKTRYVL
ncbi:collagen alpha-3(VI) chain-like [Paramormyrops kingsleyae]|uniref:collagen alpha-3(VI) chain-like n=1 Tax=Paramormyrops kingsleyae TaxID=1676925 RepID=UPI003B96F945